MRMNRLFCCICLAMAVGVSSAGYPGEEIDIAAIYALTGPAAEANAHALRGIGWAVDEINRQSGIKGIPVHLRVLDNRSTPIGSTLAARAAVEAGVLAIVGPDWSSHSLAVARIAQQAGIPMISTLSTNPEVTRIGDFIFRVCFTDDFQGKVIAAFAHRNLNAAIAVILVDVTSDYSLKLSEIFRVHFERFGGRVSAELEYKHRQRQFGDLIRRTLDAVPDVIFIPGHDESGFLAAQIQDAGASAVFLGGDGWSTPGFFRKGGASLKRAYYTTHWSSRMDTAYAKAFVRKYAIQADSADDNVALGYDAMMLLADAMGRAGALERKAIRDALSETRAFQGVTGAISFNADGDPEKDIVFMEIREGTPRYLKTMAP